MYQNQPGLRPALAAKRVAGCYDWVEALIFSLVFGMILFVGLFRIVSVNGPSMQPSLMPGDRVLLTGTCPNPHSGDIVVITHTDHLEDRIIKRVIATEGQTVNINFETGIVSVDGEPLDESGYLKNGITVQPSDFEYPLTVPEGRLFVMGDNREVSYDSRSAGVGMVDRRYVMGRALAIVYPFGRMKLL